MSGFTTFRIKPPLAALRCAYPAAEHVLQAVALGRRERAVVSRLWVSEGIPFAFRECPALYEEARTWLAEKLDLDPKEISLRGSGRLGYSLAPQRWGDAYNPQSSDLDVFAVSERFFGRFREDFERWSDDYSRSMIKPISNKEQQLWKSNYEGGMRKMSKGFLDSWMVPNRHVYPTFLKTNYQLEILWKKLHQTDVGPKPNKKITLRCYRNWRAYECQACINLKSVANFKPKS